MLKKTAVLFTFLFFIIAGTASASENDRNGLSVEELSKETGIELHYLKQIYNPDESYEVLSTTSETVSPERSDGVASIMSSKDPLYNFTLSIVRNSWNSSKHNATAQSRSLNGTINEIEARSRIYFSGKLADSKTDKQKNSAYAAATATAGCTFGIIGNGKASVYGNHTFKLKGYPTVSKEKTGSFTCHY